MAPIVDVAPLYLAGVPVADILRQCKRSPRWMYQQLAEQGIKPNRSIQVHPRYRFVDEDPLTEKIRQLRRRGRTVEEIADEIEHGVDYVSRRLTDALREMRPRVGRPPSGKPRAVALPARVKGSVQPEEIEIIKRMDAEGASLRIIANEIGRSISTVRDHRLRLRHGNAPVYERIPWPKIENNFKKAMRGRRYDDVETGPPQSLANLHKNACRLR